MAIALVRIDDRLIHGQVVEGWLPYLKAEEVVVASDTAAADPTQRVLMQLALPDKVMLHVMSIASAAVFIGKEAGGPRRILVLVPGPREALALLSAGAQLDSINVGGLHYSAGRVQLGRVIYLDEEDRRAMEALAGRGVRLEGQGLPSDAKTDIAELLRESKVG